MTLVINLLFILHINNKYPTIVIFLHTITTEDKEIEIQLSIIKLLLWKTFVMVHSHRYKRFTVPRRRLRLRVKVAMEGSVDETRKGGALDVSRAIKCFMYNLQLLPQAYTGAETNRMTLCYFCVSALDLLGSLDKIRDKQSIIEWIYNLQVVPGESKGDCDEPDFWQHSGFIGGTFMGGAFGPKGTNGRPANEHLHGHIAMTYTSIATLLILGTICLECRNAIAKSLAALQDKRTTSSPRMLVAK